MLRKQGLKAFPSTSPLEVPCVNNLFNASGINIVVFSGPLDGLPEFSVSVEASIRETRSLYSTRNWFCFFTADLDFICFFVDFVFFLASLQHLLPICFF